MRKLLIVLIVSVFTFNQVVNAQYNIVETDILSYSFAEQTGPANINVATKNIQIEVALGSNMAALIPTITVSNGATIVSASGVAQDYSNIIMHTVTGFGGLAQSTWYICVTESAVAYGTDILSYTLRHSYTESIDCNNNTVFITAPWWGAYLHNLTPTITVSNGATIVLPSGVAQDYSNPVTHVVTSLNGIDQEIWTVDVFGPISAEENSSNDFISIKPNPSNGIFVLDLITNENKDVTVDVLSLQGQVIYNKSSKSVSKLRETIDISYFAKGVYYIRINTGTDVITKKIILE